jgi:hypothetical protein
VQRWFRAKRQELLASAALAQDHTSLVGGHREFFLRAFLREFLPGRLSAERGIVYGLGDHSGECDAVIWDHLNYPRLAMLDHSSFFAESVVCVLELKSYYSPTELRTCHDRCKRLRTISITAINTGRFQHQLAALWSNICALTNKTTYEGTLYSEPLFAYGVVFLHGGASLQLSDLVSSGSEQVNDPDEVPDFMAFIEPGLFFRKFEPDVDEYEDGEEPFCELTRPGEDVLMSFADELLGVISARSFGLDGLRDLAIYRPPRSTAEIDSVERTTFTPIRFGHGYRPVFGDSSTSDPTNPDDDT